MKKLISILCFLLSVILVLCSCNGGSKVVQTDANNATETDYYNYKTDYQIGTIDYGKKVAKSEKGYYMIDEDGYIYFTDITSGKSTILCNKPNCLHENFDYNGCYGLVCPVATAIVYNDGYLYYADDALNSDYGTQICRLAPDGSGKTEVIYTCDYGINDFIIHRNNLYISYSIYNPDENDENEAARVVIEKRSVKNPENREVIFDSEEYKPFAYINYIGLFDIYLYYTADYYENDEKICIVNCYNTETGEQTEITLPDGKKLNETVYFYPLGDKIVYRYYDNLYQCDLDGKNSQLAMIVTKDHHNFTDGTYLYEDNFGAYVFGNDKDFNADKSIVAEDTRILKVYDSNYNLLNTINVGDYANYSYGATDENYFVRIAEEGGEISYFDKSQIENANKFEFLTIELIK